MHHIISIKSPTNVEKKFNLREFSLSEFMLSIYFKYPINPYIPNVNLFHSKNLPMSLNHFLLYLVFLLNYSVSLQPPIQKGHPIMSTNEFRKTKLNNYYLYEKTGCTHRSGHECRKWHQHLSG